jgi:hypothetical protein
MSGAGESMGGGGGGLKDKIKLITGDTGDLEAGIKLEVWVDRATTQLLLAVASMQPENQRYKGQASTFADFQKAFSEAAKNRFGSGWAWLIINEKKELAICSTANQDNPLMDIAEVKGYPLLGLDVWEHAYYLKYQNKRADYVNNWWNLVNWKFVEERYIAFK